jgi:hypothetical protein
MALGLMDDAECIKTGYVYKSNNHKRSGLGLHEQNTRAFDVTFE